MKGDSETECIVRDDRGVGSGKYNEEVRGQIT
jgi:hypothetical protein